MEEDYLPLSGVQHIVFCDRQCALIHVEGIWHENVLTAHGRVLHSRVHQPGLENRPGVRIERSVHVGCDRLRLTGILDVVEFHARTDGECIVPVEYKRGRAAGRYADKVQLCAQAMALEEMLDVTIDEGAIYYWGSRKRLAVPFETRLRERTLKAAKDFHRLVRERVTPRRKRTSKCDRCSLVNICLPEVTAGKESA